MRLFHDDVLPYFDATALEVPDEIEVSDGRFSIAVVASGAGSIEGESAASRSAGGRRSPAGEPALPDPGGNGTGKVIRCLGPATE